MNTLTHRLRIVALLAAMAPVAGALAQDKAAEEKAAAQAGAPAAPVIAPQPVAPVPGQLPDALRIDNPKFDWGDIPDTEAVEHVFNFTNIADQEVTIAVSASCGCTVPTLEKTTYKPGESGKVTARFDPHSRMGLQTKSLTFTITNPQGKYAQQGATLTANVKALVMFEPPKMFLSEVDHTTGQKTKLVIKGRKQGFQVLSVTPNNEHIKAVMNEPVITEENGEKITSVTVDLEVGKAAPIGTLQAQLDIKTNDEKARLQPYFLGADVVGDIRPSPAQAVLRVNDPVTPFNTTIKFDSRSGSAFHILSVETDARREMQVVTDVIPGPENTSYTVTISGVTPAEAGMAQCFLTVTTDARGGETIKVPFTAVIRKLSQAQPMAAPAGAPSATTIAPVKAPATGKH